MFINAKLFFIINITAQNCSMKKKIEKDSSGLKPNILPSLCVDK